MSRTNLIGWGVMTAGLLVWAYGYFVIGHASIVDWKSAVPNWISEFLPNLESEIGTALMLSGTVPAYWPRTK